MKSIMKFTSTIVSIVDQELGCTLTFSEKDNETECNYLLLQRAYPEDDFESNCQYIESNDLKNTGIFKNVKIDFFSTKIIVSFNKERIQVDFIETAKKVEDIAKALKKIAGNTWTLTDKR